MTRFHRDELRRRLRDADREQQARAGGLRDALIRLIEDRSLTTRAKADLLGVPDRRSFLRLGGAGVLGTAALAACGGGEVNVAESGTTTTTGDGTTTISRPVPDPSLALVLPRTAASAELLFVSVYDLILGDGGGGELPVDITFDAEVLDAFRLFRDHHRQHADALNQAIAEQGGDEVDDANVYLQAALVEPQLVTLVDQRAVLLFAQELENSATSTYTFSTGQISDGDLRQTMMRIGGIESRHAAAISLLVEPGLPARAVPNTFIDDGPQSRVPEDALLAENAEEDPAEEEIRSQLDEESG